MDSSWFFRNFPEKFFGGGWGGWNIRPLHIYSLVTLLHGWIAINNFFRRKWEPLPLRPFPTPTYTLLRCLRHYVTVLFRLKALFAIRDSFTWVFHSFDDRNNRMRKQADRRPFILKEISVFDLLRFYFLCNLGRCWTSQIWRILNFRIRYVEF